MVHVPSCRTLAMSLGWSERVHERSRSREQAGKERRGALVAILPI